MEILKTSLELFQYRKAVPVTKRIGFVPTMGALHEGHLSLVDIASQQTDIVILSIFVNPTQFNDPEDLKKYPRLIDADLSMLAKTSVAAVFIPEVAEIYPEPDLRQFDLGNISNIMEGAHRPGHFNGVAQVVSRLFDMVKPHMAFFGQKDFQQLAIIKKLVEMLQYDIEIVACPIIREPDGLAMSSRNILLTAEQREQASLISKTLFKALERSGTMSVSELKEWVTNTLNAYPFFQVEYFEIIDHYKLKPVTRWEDEGTKVGCIAIKLGRIRLIDNIIFT